MPCVVEAYLQLIALLPDVVVSLVVESYLKHVALLDLGDVVDDELVVQERGLLTVLEMGVGPALAHRHRDPSVGRQRTLPCLSRRRPAEAPSRVCLGLAA